MLCLVYNVYGKSKDVANQLPTTSILLEPPPLTLNTVTDISAKKQHMATK